MCPSTLRIPRRFQKKHSRRGGLPRGAAPFLWALLGAGAAVVPTALLTVRVRERYLAVVVSGESMEPAFHDGDFLVVDRFAFRDAPPVPGDIVFFADPRDPSRELLKRVVYADPDRGYWVEGDHAAASTDSRHFGWIGHNAIIGGVPLRYWPGWPTWAPGDWSGGDACGDSCDSCCSTSPSVGNASGGGCAGST